MSSDRLSRTTSFTIIIAAVLLTRGLALLPSSIDLDEGLYLVQAQRWLLGGLPYVQVWDQHPPALPGLLALVQMVVPDPVLGARLLTLVAVFITAMLLQHFATEFCARRYAGLLAALLYVLCISRWSGLSANPETFINACTSTAAFLLYSALQHASKRAFKAGGAAVVLGLGLQFKYNIFPEAVLLCLGFLVSAHRLHRNVRTSALTASLLILAGLLPTAIVVLYFYMHGALEPFLNANLGSNLAYLEIFRSPPDILHDSTSGIAPVIGCILSVGFCATRRPRQQPVPAAGLSPQAWITLWTVGAVLRVCLPMKFFSYYYFALYPPLCLAAALALAEAAKWRRLYRTGGLIVLFMVPVSLWLLGTVRATRGMIADGPRTVASVIRNAGGNRRVFVYDYHPSIYALAHLPPPSPYVVGSEYGLYARSSGLDGRSEIDRIMDSQPDFVVLRVRLTGEFVPAALDATLAHRLTGYQVMRDLRDGNDLSTIRIYSLVGGFSTPVAQPK